MDTGNDEGKIKAKRGKRFCLYVLTPKMEGFYSIAEVIDDSNKRPAKTLFCFLSDDDGNTFSDVQIKSLKEVREMVKSNGENVLKTWMR